MTLRVEQHPCWDVACDSCGEGDNGDYGGSYHYPTEAEAREQLQNQDWTVLPDGRALCLECYERLRSVVRCPHGAGCNGGGCGCCPTDEQVFAQIVASDDKRGGAEA